MLKKVPKICFIDFITFKILSAIYVCTINNPILKMPFFFFKKKIAKMVCFGFEPGAAGW